MNYYTPFTEVKIAPGAKERINEKLKDISKINQERPCKKCAHYYHYRMIRCGLSSGSCDFYHNKFEPVTLELQMRRKRNLSKSGPKED